MEAVYLCAFDNNPVYWSDPSGADSKPSVNLSFQGDEAVQWIFNILVSIGTYTDKHDEKAALHGFDSFEDFINTVGKTNTGSDANNDGSADGTGGPKRSTKYNNSVFKKASLASIAIISDDATGFGAADDVLIPVI